MATNPLEIPHHNKSTRGCLFIQWVLQEPPLNLSAAVPQACPKVANGVNGIQSHIKIFQQLPQMKIVFSEMRSVKFC